MTTASSGVAWTGSTRPPSPVLRRNRHWRDSPENRFVGAWSDGVPVRELSISHDAPAPTSEPEPCNGIAAWSVRLGFGAFGALMVSRGGLPARLLGAAVGIALYEIAHQIHRQRAPEHQGEREGVTDAVEGMGQTSTSK